MIKSLVTLFENLDYLKDFRLQKREFGYKNRKPGLENQKVGKMTWCPSPGFNKGADR
jgi:hypothetical protein